MDSIIDEPSGTGTSSEPGDEQTLSDSGFFWREDGGVRVLVCEKLEAAGFVNGFSTRVGGVSPFPSGDLNLAGFDEDSKENIVENRRRFLRVMGGGLKLSSVWQVHGDSIKVIRTPEDAESTNDKHDGLISDRRGLAVGVKTADCVPVLIGDTATGAYAAIHAGWRGTAAAITEKAIRSLSDEFQSRPADLIAAIGPAASCESYEIGSDVIDAFAHFTNANKYFTPTRDGHALVDLISANRDQLADSGVKAENILIAPLCTMKRTDLFFSYRIEKKEYGKTGRLMSVIGRADIAKS